jgi:hypothetical protein
MQSMVKSIDELLQNQDDGIKIYESYIKLIEQMGLDNFLTLQV